MCSSRLALASVASSFVLAGCGAAASHAATAPAPPIRRDPALVARMARQAIDRQIGTWYGFDLADDERWEEGSEEAESAAAHARDLGDLDRWLASVGSPRIRTGTDASASCGATLIAHEVVLGIDAAHEVGESLCSADGSRCVVRVELAPFDAEPTRHVLHLLFDGAALRVAALHASSAPLASELARYAETRPESWTAPCSPIIEALAADHAGEDFFTIERAETESGDGFSVERACGATADAAIAALGDDWSSDGWPPWECGSSCTQLVLDGNVLAAVASGFEVTLSEAMLAELRARVPCGGSTFVPMSDWRRD
jgi:hypothetical protein